MYTHVHFGMLVEDEVRADVDDAERQAGHHGLVQPHRQRRVRHVREQRARARADAQPTTHNVSRQSSCLYLLLHTRFYDILQSGQILFGIE